MSDSPLNLAHSPLVPDISKFRDYTKQKGSGPASVLQEHWRKHLHVAVMLVAVFTFIGAYSATQVHFVTAASPQPATWAHSFFSEFTYAYCALALSPLVILLTQRFPIRRKHWMRSAAVHILAMPLYSGAAKVAWDAIVPPKGYMRTGFSLAAMFHSAVSYSDFGAILYGVIVLSYQTVAMSRRYEAQMINAARLQTQLAQAQVQALRMQLHPHFLFNTLNSISALVRDQPEAAESMIARLSDLLRRALDTSAAQEIPLRQEIEFVRLYLDIEQTRFADRLQVSIEMDPDATEALVPNMILQPLVENAIRHGILNRTHDGRIWITARRRGSDLLLKVADNGLGAQRPLLTLHEGIGLSSTRGRLARLYGNGQCLQLDTQEAGGLIARIAIPFTTQETRKDHGEN